MLIRMLNRFFYPVNSSAALWLAVLMCVHLACPLERTHAQPLAEIDQEAVRFVFAGHVRPERKDDANPLLERLMARVEPLGLDFIVFGGDSVYGYRRNRTASAQQEWRVFFDAVAPSGIPRVLVAGNHDVGLRPFGVSYKKDFPAMLPKIRAAGFLEALIRFSTFDAASLEAFVRLVPYTYYAFDSRHVRFIVLDSVSREAPLAIGPDQLAFLKDRLATANGKRIFIFIHHPLWIAPPQGMEYSYYGYTCRESSRRWSEEVHPLLPPDSHVFAGNNLKYSFRRRDGVNYYMSGMSGKVARRDASNFILVDVRGKQVTVEPRYLYE